MFMKFNAVFNITQELTGLGKMNFNIYNYVICIIIYKEEDLPQSRL